MLDKTAENFVNKSGFLACNPHYLGGRDLEDNGLKPAWAKQSKDPISTNDCMRCHMPVTPATQGNTNRRINVQAGQGIKYDLISKITNTKRAGEMAQVVEYLPSSCKGLSSTSSTAKKKKKKIQVLCHI
jgi:hypothetical protein